MSNQEFSLVVFGMSQHEVRVLRTISILSRNRSRTYVLANGSGSEEGDFAIIDADDPQALASWNAFQDNYPMVEAIMVGKVPVSGSTEHWLKRPIMATRLLDRLDRLELSNEHSAFVVPQTDDTAPVEQAPSDVAAPAVPRALVVDDSLPIRRQVEIELERLVGNLDVDLAEDGKQAIEFISANRYDIVFLDVVLPGMDGYEICRTIKRDRGTKNTPVIMLTGKSSPFNRVRGKLAGCNTYLTKPVNRKKFDKAVQNLLR